MPLKSRDETFTGSTSAWNRRAPVPRRRRRRKVGFPQTVNQSEMMRLSQGFDSRRGFNEADFWMASLSLPAWRMWVWTKGIHLIGPALPGGSCFEDLSPADLLWDGGGWARQQECQEEVLFRYPTYKNTGMRHLWNRPNDSAQQARGRLKFLSGGKCPEPQLSLNFSRSVNYSFHIYMKESAQYNCWIFQ